MKVLVTGGLGFTGSRLVEYLLERGYEVNVLDVENGLFYESLSQKGAQIILGSVTDRESVKKSLEGVEGVFHLAAAFRKINVTKKFYRDINIEGTRIICEESLNQGVKKFVYCSTQGIHGDIKQIPGNEDSPIAPEDYYQYTKYEGEKVVLDFVSKGLKSVIIRPMAIYGPGDPARFLHLFRLARKGRFFMFGSGKAFYHPLYIDNLCDAFLKGFESNKENGEAYLIGDEHYFTIKELVQKVGEAINTPVHFIHFPFFPIYALACLCEFVCVPLKIPPPLFRRRVDWFRQNRAFSIDRAKKELNYTPKVGIEEGLKKTAEWYFQNKYL